MSILDAPHQRRVEQAVNIETFASPRRRARWCSATSRAAPTTSARPAQRGAFNDIELRHAVLHGVGNADMDLTTTILGQEHTLPFFITSCAGQRMFHSDGEVATARAAKKHGLHMALSQLTTSTFEEVREAHPDGAKTLQLYVWRDRVLLKEVLDRAKEWASPP